MKKKSKILAGFLAVTLLAASFTGCGNAGKAGGQETAVTVDKTEISMDEMQYHLLLAEMQGQLYASYMNSGENYWDVEYEEGVTLGEALKDMALENAIKYELFYQKALEAGDALTESDKENNRSKVESFTKNFTRERLSKLGLTEEKLIKLQDKIALAAISYSAFEKGVKTEEDKVKETIKKEDYQQYDIQYLYGKDREEMEKHLSEAETAEDITELDQSESLNSGKLSFLEGKDTFGEEKNLEETIPTMQQGEVSGIVETVKGFYILKLVSNTSDSLYQEALEQALTEAKQIAVEKAYEALKKDHKISVNHKIWDKVTLGK